MGKTVFIAEKPSVARQFAEALKLKTTNHKNYLESENTIITWCVGHLITLSMPEKYDEKYKAWSFSTLPFIPDNYLYEVIGNVKEQFDVVKKILNREDVDSIYVCTDSGREGEYIYRLVEKQAGVSGKIRKRVWIDSQTNEEIIRGIKEAKDLSEYDNLAHSAYLRAIEDYLMGINFSRALAIKYSQAVKGFLNIDRPKIAVGRVMTCVMGMVVRREREIRDFVKTPFYRVNANIKINNDAKPFPAEFKAVEGSKYYESPLLYSEKGFKARETAEKLINDLKEKCALSEGGSLSYTCILKNIEKKKEIKNPPLLYNLADLQNECSKLFKISPEQTLDIVQTLYERKLVTYPRTDARVLSSAVAKEIYKNITGLKRYPVCSESAVHILQNESYKGISKTKYVNDKQITDHYAVIPTGQGLEGLNSLTVTHQKVYEIIARRFLSIFYPPAQYEKVSICAGFDTESFFAGFKVLRSEGFLELTKYSFAKKNKDNDAKHANGNDSGDNTDSADDSDNAEDLKVDLAFLEVLKKLKKGDMLHCDGFEIKEGETSPPKRYTSGSLIIAMENAGQQIEDNDEFREQLKGSGIGTSATRAGIIEKLCKNKYLKLNNKTQVITPELLGEMLYDVVDSSIRPLLDPKLTASWEKGLTMVAEGSTTQEEYKEKLYSYIRRRTELVRGLNNQNMLMERFKEASKHYKTTTKYSGQSTKKSHK